MHDPLPISPEPPPEPASRPSLPGRVVVRPGRDEAIDAAALELMVQAQNCVRTFGDFHLAVSATAGLEPLLARLMYDPALRDLPWKRTHLWLVDEVAVPTGDPRARSERLRGLIVEPSDMPEEQFHPIRAGLADAAEEYERTLRETLGWREKGHDRLDYVLFAADPDSPLLSPPAGDAPDRLVLDRPVGETVGVAMTARMINAARFLAVFAAGDASGPAVRGLSQQWRSTPPAQRETDDSLPLGLVLSPLAGELRWYVALEPATTGDAPQR
ncbi:MAG: 6-phosphogluconolactonase [Phycisphaeraceae bacterium]|nr:MAG: 6-phosphogluconolactonase [Phycisphaeraceae bacterium]